MSPTPEQPKATRVFVLAHHPEATGEDLERRIQDAAALLAEAEAITGPLPEPPAE